VSDLPPFQQELVRPLANNTLYLTFDLRGGTMRFVAIDVETANSDMSSICQVGIAEFADGVCTGTWQSLVNPEDWFDSANVAVHGISESTVVGSPTFPGVYESICERCSGMVVACHTPFDRTSIKRASEKHCLEEIDCDWLDTARVTRRAWPEFSKTGYRLANVTSILGIKYIAHDALEDARAAGEVFIRAMEKTGLSLDQWLVRVAQPIAPTIREFSSIAMAGNPDGPLYGEVVVFTGALVIPRRTAARLAAEAGCQIAESVTKSTTLLVAGDQDITRLAGCDRSSKHRKAEDLLAKGHPIRIIGESDFRRVIGDDE
jgi:DNA polymerase III subunit epsilon